MRVCGVCVQQSVGGCVCASARPRGMYVSVKGSTCANAWGGGACAKACAKAVCARTWPGGRVCRIPFDSRGVWVCVEVPVRGMRVQEPVVCVCVYVCSFPSRGWVCIIPSVRGV